MVAKAVCLCSFDNMSNGVQVPERSNLTRLVHIDSFSAMTGVSRFLELSPPWSYSKVTQFHLIYPCPLPGDALGHSNTPRLWLAFSKRLNKSSTVLHATLLLPKRLLPY